ncbi:MAG: hypothetical protein AB2L09_08435 [Coriobacteriia bacterium]
MSAHGGDQAAIAAFLKGRTEIVEPMFAQFNLRLVGHSFKIGKNNYWLSLLFEIAALDGTSLRVSEDSCGVLVKANLYDESGGILDSSSCSVSLDGFSGYDTDEIMFCNDGIALAADRVRLFAVRWG